MLPRFLGMDPEAMLQEIGLELAKAMASRDPIQGAIAFAIASDMMKWGAAALALGDTPEHVEECPEDHTPSGFLEKFAEALRDADEEWTPFYEEFWKLIREAQAEEELSELPGQLKFPAEWNDPDKLND